MPKPVELSQYVITWRLPEHNFGKAFTIRGEFTDPIAAAEEMFLVTNRETSSSPDSERWTKLGHRSLSVGDHVNVNGTRYLCEKVGWRQSQETDNDLNREVDREGVTL